MSEVELITQIVQLSAELSQITGVKETTVREVLTAIYAAPAMCGPIADGVYINLKEEHLVSAQKIYDALLHTIL